MKNINLFQSYTFTWWQIGILKLALLSLGAVIGAYWHDFFEANSVVFIFLTIIASVIIMIISLKQMK